MCCAGQIKKLLGCKCWRPWCLCQCGIFWPPCHWPVFTSGVFNIKFKHQTHLDQHDLSRLTSHGICGVVGGETKWIGARGSPPPFMIQVFIVNRYCHLFISQLILNNHRHPIKVLSNFKYKNTLLILLRRELPIFWASVSRLPTWHRPFAASPTPCGIGMKLKKGQFTEEKRYGVFFPSIGSIYEVSHMRLLKSEDHRWFLMSCKISEQQKWPSSFLQSSYFFINPPLRSKWCPWNLPAVGQD